MLSLMVRVFIKVFLVALSLMRRQKGLLYLDLVVPVVVELVEHLVFDLMIHEC